MNTRQDTADQMDIRDPMDRAPNAEPASNAEPIGEPAPASAETVGHADGELTPDLWDSNTAGQLRQRWHEIQATFIDDPKAAAEKAESLVNEATQHLTAALSAQRSQAQTGQSDGEGGDTERLRQTVQRYREVFDRLLGV